MRTLCLTQPEREDRWKLARQEFDRVGIDAEPFYSIPDRTPYISFCLSQKAILDEIASGADQSVLVLEDDAIFTDFKRLGAIQLPGGWDCLYLGANVREAAPQRVTGDLFRLRSAWMSHAILYSRDLARVISQNYKPLEDGMYDDWLSREVLPKYNCFLMAPMIAWQRPGKSDLWGIETDYTGAFDAINERLSKL